LTAPQLNTAILRDPVHLLATGFGVGLSRHAPGTAGSVLALLPCAWVLAWPWQWQAVLAAAVFVAGVVICDASARRLGVHDHPAIVLDEIAAMLTVTLFVPPGWPWIVVALVVFRFFDIVKPWPIRDMDHRLRGGLGIMLDDQMAAAYTGICLLIAQRIVAIA
jgi:phosphatidylglycerophosphatase A